MAWLPAASREASPSLAGSSLLGVDGNGREARSDLWQTQGLGLCHRVGVVWAWEGTLFLPTPLARWNPGVSLGIPRVLTRLGVVMRGWWFSPARLLDFPLHFSSTESLTPSPDVPFPRTQKTISSSRAFVIYLFPSGFRV